MTNKTVIIENLDGTTTEQIIIDHGNEQFTSMPKSEYDRQQAEQSTPMVADE
jgi:hypothetical protein